MDLFGPDGVVRAVASRPSEPNNPAATDSFFNDCVGGAPGTGTPIPAHWLNRITANLRAVARKSGQTDTYSDNLVALAVRSQRLNYFPSVGGSANAITLTMDPSPADYASLLGTPIRFGPSGRNTGNTTVNINGLGTKQIIRRGGTQLQPGDLVAGEIAEIIYDGVAFQLFVVPAGFRNLVVFSSNGSFTVPAGVRRLRIRVWGGGGGGGGSIGATSAALAGAGGGYSEGLFDVTPGDVYAVTIGTGGSGGTSGAFGGPGTTTSVGALISATGGGGGTGSNNAGIINGGTTGGQGFGGQINIQAYGGGSGYAISGAVFSGPGGGSFCIPGAPMSVASPTPPGAALGGFYPAGGGNGGAGTQAGGAGQPGLVLIEY